MRSDQDYAVRIVIVGAGEVGSYLAERLSREDHDVVVVDRNRARTRELAERLDVHVVNGNGSSPQVLAEAGLDETDLLIAVTDRDEVNLVACMLARQHGVGTTVVRIEDRDLRDTVRASPPKELAADLVIDPDAETAEEIIHLVEFRGVDEVHEVVGGDLVVLGARIRPGAPLVGRSLAQIAAENEPHWDTLFGTITRGHETFIPRGNHVLDAGDHVRVVMERRATERILRLLGIERTRVRRAVVLGGGRIGGLVTGALTRRGVAVTVIERDPERAQDLAMELPKALVVSGDATDADLLLQENVPDADVVIAATGEDDANILACSYSESEGGRWSIVVVHRLTLIPLLRRLGIDAIVTPRTASANAVLRFVRGGISVATFLEGDVEVDEIEVQKGSRADGALIAELRLPKEVLIGAVVRDGNGQIARGRTQLRARDRLVVFAKPRALPAAREVLG